MLLPHHSSPERVCLVSILLQALHEAEMRQEQIEGDVRSRQTELRRQSDQERRLKDDMQTLRRSQGQTCLSAALCPWRLSPAKATSDRSHNGRCCKDGGCCR